MKEVFKEKELTLEESDSNSAGRSFLVTAFFLLCAAAGIISVAIVLAFRHRKILQNMIVIRESNSRLDGLLYLLVYSVD